MISAAEVRRRIAQMEKQRRIKREALRRMVGDVQRGELASGGVKAVALRAQSGKPAT